MWYWIRTFYRRIVRNLGQRRSESEEEKRMSITNNQGMSRSDASEAPAESTEVRQAMEILSSTPVMNRGDSINLQQLEAEISALVLT